MHERLPGFCAEAWRSARRDGQSGSRWRTEIRNSPKVAYLGQQTVQGGLISDRAGDDSFLPVAGDLEVLEPAGPPSVEDAFDADLVA